MTTSPAARCTAEHLVDEPVLHVATNSAGDVVWLGAGTAVRVLSSKLVPVVGFELGTSGTNVTSLAVADDAVAVVSATTLELYALVGRSIAELDLPATYGVAEAAFTADGRTLVWGGSHPDGRGLAVQIIDATTGEVLASPSVPVAERIECCSVVPAGERGVLVGGWEGDGEHCNIVVRVDADAGTLTALDEAEGCSLIGASPTGGVALVVPHGSSELCRLDVAGGGVRQWLHEFTSDDGRHAALNSLGETSRAAFLGERLAVVSSEHEDPLLVDVGADDGSPRPMQLGCVFEGPRFVRRLGPAAFLTVEAMKDGARLRAWAV